MTTQATRHTRHSSRAPVFSASFHEFRARHSKEHCVRILRGLSAYLDGDLPTGVCQEIRKHLGACPRCEQIVESLRQTVGLCRHLEPRPISGALKSRIRRFVLQAAGRSH